MRILMSVIEGRNEAGACSNHTSVLTWGDSDAPNTGWHFRCVKERVNPENRGIALACICDVAARDCPVFSLSQGSSPFGGFVRKP